MLPRTLRVVLICVVVLSVIAIPAIGSPSERVDRTPTAGIDPRLQKIAQATGHDAAHLQLLAEEPVQLLNGKMLIRYKALDVKTSEIVGATFEGNRPADYEAELTAAGQQWRAAHGAITPQLLAELSKLGPADRLNIAVWLKADVRPLPRPPDTRMDNEAGRETAGPMGAVDVVPPAARADKSSAQAVPLDQAPPEVRASVLRESGGGASVEKALVEAEKPVSVGKPAAVPDTTASLAQMDAFKQRNNEALKAQIAPVQARFLQLMKERELSVAYASENAPSATLNQLTRQQVESLAFLPEIDAIYAVPKNAGPSLANARPTQNMVLVNNVGYIGTGVKASVTEGERGFAANPYLTWSGFRDGGQPYQPHPTAVGGMIKSTALGFNGLANGVQLYSSNGSYSDWGIMSSAMDWGVITATATVLNNSWYWDNTNNNLFWEADRHQDYLARYHYDFVAVAAGNFGNGCTGSGGFYSNYVVSPAKGYNVMSVGNYEDNDTLGWADDNMDVCSSFGDPAGDMSTLVHAKPEVAAVGSTISSTLISTSALITEAIGPVGSGTSYASPMVTSLAADIIGAAPGFSDEPERVKSIIMATALHNIEGNAKFSDKDGAGGIDGAAALATVEREHSDDLYIDSSTTFPITYTQFAYKGERVRFVINWQSNPVSDYTSDPLPADLDLVALRQDQSTVLDSSTSSYNSFEIVDFVAPASETYYFRISEFSYSGSNTWLGIGWWRGTYRISPDVTYTDLKASPLGTHLSVYPTDWPPTNYWRAFGIRPVGSDHDLELYTRSQFDDPGQRTYLRGSYALSGTVDFLVTDGNHWPSGNQEQYLVNHFLGTGGYYINWSNPGIVLTPGLYGPYSMGTAVVRVYDVWVTPRQTLRISVIPTAGNQADLAARLFQSSSGSSASWAQDDGMAVRVADSSVLTSATESLIYPYSGASSDYLGLVVSNKSNASGQYYIYVEQVLYLPLIMK
jgi:hypothetical protein